MKRINLEKYEIVFLTLIVFLLIVINFLIFHDFFKVGEQYSLAEYLTGLVSILVVIFLFSILTKFRK